MDRIPIRRMVVKMKTALILLSIFAILVLLFLTRKGGCGGDCNQGRTKCDCE